MRSHGRRSPISPCGLFLSISPDREGSFNSAMGAEILRGLAFGFRFMPISRINGDLFPGVGKDVAE